MSWNIEGRRLSAPICLTWQVTAKCNLRCIHCLSGDQKSSSAELSMEEIRAFLDDLATSRVFYINVGGGEPLLHPNFFEITEYAQKRGVFIQFSTNGTLIDGRVAAVIAEQGLRVQISLDGWEASVNDPIRGAGTFDQALAALRLLREKKVEVSVNGVVTRDMMRGLDKMLEMVTAYGASLRLSRLRPSGRAHDKWQDLAPTADQRPTLYGWLQKHPEVRTGDSFFFLSPLGEPLPGLSYCGTATLTCSVDPHGTVYPCPFTLTPALAAGNIREKALSRLWREGDILNRMNSQKPEGCRGCSGYSKCRGGCRGASYLVYGDWNRPDPECVRGEANGQVSV